MKLRGLYVSKLISHTHFLMTALQLPCDVYVSQILLPYFASLFLNILKVSRVPISRLLILKSDGVQMFISLRC